MNRTSPGWVLLHPFGGSGRSWGPLMRALGGTCIAPDLRGFGDVPPGETMHVADYADDVAALLPPDFVLVGHSMGGKIALALAARKPAGLRGLVLVAPSPPGPEPMEEAARAKLRAAWGDPIAAQGVAHDITRHRDGPVFDRIVADHMRASWEAWAAWLDAGSREDLQPLAALVAVPVLVVAGADDDALGPVVQARVTLPLLPGAAMHVIPDSKHLIPQDQPDALVAVMQGWAAGLPAAV